MKMATSPSSSPRSKWNSSVQGTEHGSGHLLQELEAMTQTLYQSQKKVHHAHSYISPPVNHPQYQPQDKASPARKFSFGSRKDSPRSGHLLAHNADESHASTTGEPISYSHLSHSDPPPSFANLLSRHSLSSVHAPTSAQPRFSPSYKQEKTTPNNSQPRFSSSVAPSHKDSAWTENRSEVRSRVDRRSYFPSPSRNQEKLAAQEQDDWDEESESSRRFDSSSIDKKKSVWNWKPLRALSHIGRHRLHCVFSAYVRAIEGLSPAMNGVRLCVHMRKEETKEGAVQTMPTRVFQGIAEFQETLFMKCTLYSSKGSSSTVKFMEKAFIMSVIAPDIDELDFGKHQVDFSRLLSDFIDEKKGKLEKGNSWDFMLDLTGKARGGKLSITVNYEILEKDSSLSSGNTSFRFRQSPPHRSSLQFSVSLPNSAHGTPRNTSIRTHLSRSPYASEPSNDYDDLLAMDQLSLDEPPSAPIRQPAYELRGDRIVDNQIVSPYLSKPEYSFVHSHGALNDLSNHDSKLKTAQMPTISFATPSLERQSGVSIDRKEDSSDDDRDFVVVDKGVEIDESVKKNMDNVNTHEEIDSAEEEGLDDPIPRLVQIDAMDDLPQVVDIKPLGDLPSPETASMETLDEYLPSAIQMQPSHSPVHVEDKVYTDMHDLQVTTIHASDTRVDVLSGEKLIKVHNTNSEQQEVVELDTAESSVKHNDMHLDDEKIVEIEERKRKDEVSYSTVMETLDSLTQRLSLRELPQEIEKVDVESSADGIFSDDEDTLDKEVINITSPSMFDEHKTSYICELNNAHDSTESNDDAEHLSENSANKQTESRNATEITIDHNVTAAENNELEENDCHSDVSDGRGSMQFFEALKESCTDSEDEVVFDSTHSEEEIDSIVEDEEFYIHTNAEELRRCSHASNHHVSSAVSDNEANTCNDDVNIEEGSGRLSDVESNEKHGNSEINHISNGKGEMIGSNVSGEHIYKTLDAASEEETAIETGSNSAIQDNFANGGSQYNDTLYDDVDTDIDLVAEEFLDMLGMGSTSVGNDYDNEADSPQVQPLQDIEEEFNLDANYGNDSPAYLFDGLSVNEDVVAKHSALQGSTLKLVDDQSCYPSTTEVHKETDIENSVFDCKYPRANFSSSTEESANGEHHASSLKDPEHGPADSDEAATAFLWSLREHQERDHLQHLEMAERKSTDLKNIDVLKQTVEEPCEEEHTSYKDGLQHLEVAGDQQPTDLNHSAALKETVEEPETQDYTLSSELKEKQVKLMQENRDLDFQESDTASMKVDIHSATVLNKQDAMVMQHRAIDLKETETNPVYLDLHSASEKETADVYHTTSFWQNNDPSASHVGNLELKMTEEMPIISGNEGKPIDRDDVFPSTGIDEASSNQDHILSSELEEDDHSVKQIKLPAERSVHKETKLDHSVCIEDVEEGGNTEPSEGINSGSPSWSHALLTGDSAKPISRTPDSALAAVDSLPIDWDFDQDEELMSFIEAAESEMQRATQNMQSKSRAKMLEDAETEALMQEWGLNERAFESSPPRPTKMPQEPPPLGKGLSAAIPLKDGGALRSMNPSLFQGSKSSSGKLVMQISKPLVVPAAMGKETVDILRNMASMGIENMAVQAMSAMPLEDITGRSAEQIACEGITPLKSGELWMSSFLWRI
ncbi:hypothetical protein KP509_32G018400 [Ceratopteris richardii]|uniref:C2 NT-type domain-containing protein n=1 Tax=Ceratopteris richardii TaxID=49495 RepID=A0A8T2QTL2_CERRI|nr:hypothetical protein KP509_32G018400 [Ceratopteris richardii]